MTAATCRAKTPPDQKASPKPEAPDPEQKIAVES
jgi:hypothetical protein